MFIAYKVLSPVTLTRMAPFESFFVGDVGAEGFLCGWF